MREALIPKSHYRRHSDPKLLLCLGLAISGTPAGGIAAQADSGSAQVAAVPQGARPTSVSAATTPYAVLPPGETSGPATSSAAAPSQYEELLLEVDVNEQGLKDTVVVLRAPGGRLFFSEEDLKRWRVKIPPEGGVITAAGRYYPLASITGAKSELDEVNQRLKLRLPAEAFETAISGLMTPAGAPPPIVPQRGGFLNYSLSASDSGVGRVSSGLFEAGYFSSTGAFDNTFSVPRFEGSARAVRLESTYAIDYPEKLSSVRLGDSINGAGSWGLPVRFGGVQYRTNFNTQPGFIRSPIAVSASGLAALPSVVDVFVNNALVSRQSVAPGPFSVTNIPVVSGGGEVRLVVRDLLGREQIITQPFYRNVTLLKRGLSEYSYEAGVVREDFSVASNRYGSPLATATYRYGLTDFVTSELHGEVTRDLAALGSTASVLFDRVGLITVTAAGSEQAGRSGALGAVGFERQTRALSFAVNSQWTSIDFRQIGLALDQPPRRRQTSATAGMQFGVFGSLSATYVIQQFRDQPQNEIVSLGYNIPLGRYAQLNFAALKSISESGGKSFFTTLAIPIDGYTSATVSRERNLSQTGNSTVDSVLVQKSLPQGDGYGYRLQKRGSDTLAGLSLQNRVGTYSVEAANSSAASTAWRVDAAGGLGYVGGHLFATRTIADSFGVVRVADFPNVRVLQDNQVVARTDESGYAVIPRLRPYDRNPISIEQNDVPLDSLIGGPRLVAVPYYKSGVMLDFPIKRVRAGVLRIADESGADIPSGALAQIEGGAERFPVALRGELYMNGFANKDRVVITWQGRSCTIEVVYPQTSDPLPDLGTYVCKGLRP
jgi:outer membrane usher protein